MQLNTFYTSYSVNLLSRFFSFFCMQIANIFKLGDYFFQLDDNIKQKYARPASGSGHGWVAFEREK